MAVDALEDAPVACQVAEVLASAGTGVGDRGGRRSRRSPAGRAAGRTHDAGCGVGGHRGSVLDSPGNLPPPLPLAEYKRRWMSDAFPEPPRPTVTWAKTVDELPILLYVLSPLPLLGLF